jgi:transcription elongation factor GreA
MNEVDTITEPQGGIYLTAEGHVQLQQELEFLTTVKRPEIADRIRESQQHGEFSEDNSELDAVKFDQAMVENRVAELKTILGNAHVLEPNQIPTDHVGIGSLVTVDDPEFGDRFEVRVVTTIEADPGRDYISNESPLGTALVGHSKGDEVTFDAPEGRKRFRIANIAK